MTHEELLKLAGKYAVDMLSGNPAKWTDAAMLAWGYRELSAKLATLEAEKAVWQAREQERGEIHQGCDACGCRLRPVGGNNFCDACGARWKLTRYQRIPAPAPVEEPL